MSVQVLNHACQLLVSVQNVQEAAQARQLGVPWIDLKSPARGSLGQPDLMTARNVAELLNQSSSLPQCQCSAALGELQTIDVASALQIMRWFSIVKIGFAALATRNGELDANHRQRLISLWAQRPNESHIVLAMYADYQRASAPKPDAILDLARELGSPYVLIDTFRKDGRGLFHWLSVRELDSLRQQAADFNAQLVIAGSLRATDWPNLNALGPSIVGVRGDVCTANTDRTSGLSSERVRQWLAWTCTAAVA